MQATKSRFKRLITNLLLLILSVVFSLLFLEGLFRIFDIRGYHEPRTREWNHALVPENERIPGVRFQFKPYSQFEFNYDSNPRGYFNENNGLTYYINKYGFRGDDYAIHKQPNTKRIVVLGDSFTFGEGVKLEDTFCRQLQEILNRQFSVPVEVLNFGISAWGTKDEINYLAHKGMKFGPDLVLIVYVLNDADYAGGLDLWESFRLLYEKKAYSFSYLISYFYARITRARLGKLYTELLTYNALQYQKNWQESFFYLSKGKELTASFHIQYAVIIFPFMYELNEKYPFFPIHQMIKEYCLKHDIPVLDLFDAFKGQSYGQLWVHPSDQHPNEKGHKIAADAIAEFILGNSLL